MSQKSNSIVKSKKDNYKIQFHDQQDMSLALEKQIKSVQIRSELNEASKLTLTIAVRTEQVKKITLSQFPKGISVEWDKTPYFKGESTHIRMIGTNLVEVVYQDTIHRLSRMYTDISTKDKKLDGFIRSLLSALPEQPDIKFQSPSLFDEVLPTFSLGYRSIREILDELATFYGFSYCVRQIGQKTVFLFIRAGNSHNSQPIPISILSTPSKPLLHHQRQWKYDTVTVALADNTGETLKKQIRPSSMKDPLTLFSAGNEMKKDFEIRLPEIDLHISHRELYNRAERILPYQYTQNIQFSDVFQFTLLEPKAMPGDSIQLRDSLPKYQDKSIYVIKSTELSITSSQPKLTLIAIRP